MRRLRVIDKMQDFEKHKLNFFSFLSRVDENDKKVGIISHANCTDGMASVIFMIQILKKKFPWIDADINFITYTKGKLDELSIDFYDKGIRKVFVLDLNVDASLFDEFEKFKSKFDVLFVDHHPLNPDLRIDEKVIKTHKDDCTSLVLFRFGEDVINYDKWNWLACVTAVSEFSYKDEDNLKFIQKHYDFNAENASGSKIFDLVNKINSLITYYSKDSLKAYEVLLKGDFNEIEKINKEVSEELDRCLKDFEENAEKYFDGYLCFYLFKPRFSFGSTLSTIMSVRHKGSTIIVISEVDEDNKFKVSARNNGVLRYSMNDMLKSGILGLEGALAGGHAVASGGSFLRRDLDKFKKNIIDFVRDRVNN